MRLSHLAATDLHRQHSLAYDLDPVTMFVGPNGSGKSTALGVLALVLNGRSGSKWPVLGESPDYDWSAQLSFGGRPQIARYRAGNTNAATFNGIGGAEKAMAEKIGAAVGRAGCWSIDSFLDLAPQRRLQFVEAEILDGIGWTVERAGEALEAIGAGRSALAEVIDVAEPPDEDGRVLLLSIAQGLLDVAARADADARRLSGAVAQDDKESEAEGLPPGTAASWRARVAEVDVEIKTRREERGRMIGSAGTRYAIEATLAELDGQILAHDATDWDLTRAAHAAAVVCAEEVITKTQTRIAEVEADKARAVEVHGRRKAELADAATADEAAVRARDEVKQIQRAVEQSAAAYAMLRRIAADADRCPICGSTQNIDPPGHVHAEDCELAALVRQAEQAAADGGLDRLEGIVKETHNAREACKVGEQAALRTIESLKTNASALAARIILDLAELDRAQKALVGADDREKTAGDTRVALGERRAYTLAELDTLTESSTEAIDVLLEGLEAERGQAQRAADIHTDATERTASRIARRQALTDAQAQRTRARELHKLVSECIETMLAELVAPFEEPIDRIVQKVIGQGFRATTQGGLCFWLTEGMRTAMVPFDTASRSERAVVMMALRSAIQSKLGGWRHLVLDDMENLEADRRGRFLAAMVEEVEAGRLDNFVGASVDDGWRPAPPVRLHLLARSLA